MNISALKSGNFRTYLFGNIFALNAFWMQRVTIGWISWDLTDAAGFVGLVAFVNFIPAVLAGPLFGVLVDRINVKTAALTTQSLLLLIALLLLLTAYLDAFAPWLLLLFSACSGLVSAAHNPVRMSLAPRLVPQALVSSVINMVAINFNLARLTGPAIGGVTIASLGVTTSLAIQTLCYLPFLLALSTLVVRPRPARAKGSHTYAAALTEGFRHVLSQPLILRAMLVTAAMGFIIRGTLEILPVLADGVFSKGASGLGMLTASAGLGALIAGIGMALAPAQIGGKLRPTALLSAWIGVLLVPLTGIVTAWPAALALVCGLGFASTMTGVSMQTTIQLQLDDEMRGRVMSIWIMVAIGAAAFGAAILGFAADLVGFPTVLAWAGGIGAIALGGFILRVWSLK